MEQPFYAIAQQYNLLNDLLSFGLHRLWKKRLVCHLLRIKPAPAQILDLATGTGDVAALFARKLPESHVIPLDPCLAMMEEGKNRYPELQNWTQGQAEKLPFPDQTICIVTCTFGIRNFQDRKKGFEEIARVLKPGGLLGALEIHPIPPKWIYSPFSFFWKFMVPGVGALFQRRKAYEYLRNSGAGFISAEDMIEELKPHFVLKIKKYLLAGGLVSFTILERR